MWTDGEITAAYRMAKYKKAQITILAELNGCKKEDIEQVLIRNGYDPKEVSKVPRRKKEDIEKERLEQSQNEKRNIENGKQSKRQSECREESVSGKTDEDLGESTEEDGKEAKRKEIVLDVIREKMDEIKEALNEVLVQKQYLQEKEDRLSERYDALACFAGKESGWT